MLEKCRKQSLWSWNHSTQASPWEGQSRPVFPCSPLSPVEAGVCVLQEDSCVSAALENTITAELIVRQQETSEVLKRQEIFSMRSCCSTKSKALPPRTQFSQTWMMRAASPTCSAVSWGFSSSLVAETDEGSYLHLAWNYKTQDWSGDVLCVLSCLSPTLCNPVTLACQAPLSTGFSRQEYWGR